MAKLKTPFHDCAMPGTGTLGCQKAAYKRFRAAWLCKPHLQAARAGNRWIFANLDKLEDIAVQTI